MWFFSLGTGFSVFFFLSAVFTEDFIAEFMTPELVCFFFFLKKTREIKWDLELTQRYCEAQMDLAYVWCFGDKPSKCLRHFTWPVWQNLFGHGGGGFCLESTTFSSTTWQCLAEELSFQNSAGVEIGRWLMHRPGVASARLDGINGPLDDTQEVHWCTCQFKWEVRFWFCFS